MADNIEASPPTPNPVPPVTPPTPPKPPVTPAPAAPAKPKSAYVVIEPLETLTPEPPETNGTTPSAPAPKVDPKADSDHIVATGALTIVMVKTGGTPKDHHKWNGVKLPKDAADLSVVEVHRDPTSTGGDVAVYPNKGEQIGALPINDGKNTMDTGKGVSSASPVSFRKMSKTLWAVV